MFNYFIFIFTFNLRQIKVILLNRLFRKIINISPSGDLDEAASKLFSSLHELESLGVDSIAVMPILDFAVGKAINDRLLRAARGAGGDENAVHD